MADLQGSIDVTMNAFGVIGKAKTPLDETTMSMKWEVFGWPQKVNLNCSAVLLSINVLWSFSSDEAHNREEGATKRLGQFCTVSGI